MIYAYIRVSTDKQSVENQRFEVSRFVQTRGWEVHHWIDDVISGTRKKTVGKFGQLLKRLLPGDMIIVSELSRLGRSLMEIMSILHDCMQMDVRVLAIKEGYELGDNISSKVLAFAFGLSAEIERNLISQRTKEALARKRADGVVLGRKRGSKNPSTKLTGKETEIQAYLQKRVSVSAIARLLGVHRLTVAAYILEKNLNPNIEECVRVERLKKAEAHKDKHNARERERAIERAAKQVESKAFNPNKNVELIQPTGAEISGPAPRP